VNLSIKPLFDKLLIQKDIYSSIKFFNNPYSKHRQAL